MNLPTEIKFGHRTIDVRYDKELSPSRDILSTGHTDLAYIEVQPSLPEELQAECIFRGIVHQITDVCGLTHEAKDRSIIGTALFATIRDNPNLLLVGAPEKVRIFGQNWVVVGEEAHYHWAGRKENQDNTLHINAAYEGNKAWQVLWHEVLHALWDKMQLEISEDEDERDVEVLAFSLCLLFTQNDFSWLLEADDEC